MAAQAQMKLNSAYDHDENDPMELGKAAYCLQIARTFTPRPAVLKGLKCDGLVFVEQPEKGYSRGKLKLKDEWKTSGGNRQLKLMTSSGREVLLWRARGWLQRTGLAEAQRFSVYVLGDASDPPRARGGRHRSKRVRLYHIETTRKKVAPNFATDPDITEATAQSIDEMAAELPGVTFSGIPIPIPIPIPLPRPSTDWKRQKVEQEHNIMIALLLSRGVF
eukprot:COSAG05_NODE_3693_length_1902_cov_1.190793_2_plen_220_part_00